MTEREFLERREILARQRMSRAASSAKNTITEAVDVAEHIRRHPLASCGAGAAAGAAVGAMLKSGPGGWLRSVVGPTSKIVLAGVARSLAVDLLMGRPEH